MYFIYRADRLPRARRPSTVLDGPPVRGARRDPDLVAGRDHGARAVPRRVRHDPVARRRLRRRPGAQPDRHARGFRRMRAAGAGHRPAMEVHLPLAAYGGLETPTLELPANRMIEFHVTSLDVIHSFWAYQLGVKADANPGFDNVAYVTTKGPLTFNIHCAELCGVFHGYMFEHRPRRAARASSRAGSRSSSQQYAPVTKLLAPYAKQYFPAPKGEVDDRDLDPRRPAPSRMARPDRLQPADGDRAGRRGLADRQRHRHRDPRPEPRLLRSRGGSERHRGSCSDICSV